MSPSPNNGHCSLGNNIKTKPQITLKVKINENPNFIAMMTVLVALMRSRMMRMH